MDSEATCARCGARFSAEPCAYAACWLRGAYDATLEMRPVKMNDGYSHIDDSVIYIEENIPGPAEQSQEYKELIDNFNSQLTTHCTCSDDCEHETCNCLKQTGLIYIKCTENGRVKHILNFSLETLNKYPIVECNSLCKCSEECLNRLVQKGPLEDLVIKVCDNEAKGFGLYTKESIPKGAFICEYSGELITRSEAISRHEANKVNGRMNYIYCLIEHCNGKSNQIFVDPSKFGNIGRYINHSCEPNCIILPVRVDSPLPKLAIFSCTNINANEEITFDYGTYNIEFCLKTPNDSSTAADRKKCLCLSINCKKLMPYEIY